MAMRLADVRTLAHGVDRLVLWLRRSGPAEYSSSAMSALDRLLTEGPLRVSELARSEAMTQPGVTILVNRLAEAELAERVPDPADGRASLVRITRAGADAITRRHDARAAALRERIALLSDEDQRLLAAALPAIERLVPSNAAASGSALTAPAARATATATTSTTASTSTNASSTRQVR